MWLCRRGAPVVTTNAGGPVVLGAAGADLTDTATLSNATDNATGTITFRLYSNDTCTTQVGTDRTASVSGNGTYSPATPIHVTAAGHYYWIANYGGDGNNNPTANGCNAANEDVVVSPR